MNHEAAGDRRRATDESVRLGAGILDRQIADGDLRAFWHGARPWAIDLECAQLVIKSDRSARQSRQHSKTADEDAELLHGTTSDVVILCPMGVAFIGFSEAAGSGFGRMESLIGVKTSPPLCLDWREWDHLEEVRRDQPH